MHLVFQEEVELIFDKAAKRLQAHNRKVKEGGFEFPETSAKRIADNGGRQGLFLYTHCLSEIVWRSFVKKRFTEKSKMVHFNSFVEVL